jgi:hypothetical protein
MAIRYREDRNSWQVYWKDPFTQRQKTKLCPTLKDAERFQKQVTGLLEVEKRKAKKERQKNRADFSGELVAVPTCDTLEEFKTTCQRLAADAHTTPADLFDFIMERLDLPTRYADVVRTARQTTKREAIPARLRVEVLERDGRRCCICGASAQETKLHIDHIIPVSKGGLTEKRNLQTLCEKCNLGKSDRYIVKPIGID